MSNAESSIFLILLFKSIAHDPAKRKRLGLGLKSLVIFAGEKVDIIALFISDSGWKQDSRMILHLVTIVRND